MKRELRAGKVYWIEGPAYLKVIEGELRVLGKVLRPREDLIVPKAKAASIEVVKDSIVELRLDEEAKFEEVEQPLVPSEWQEAARRILERPKPIRVVVLGSIDSGKTTFTVFLANCAVERGLKTYVIDKDIGQSDIGAPTTIGLGRVRRPITTLGQARMVDGYFVGSTSPAFAIHRVIIGTRVLMERALALGGEMIIVNTSGWVFGWGARELKWNLIMSLRPDVVVALERQGEIEHLLRALRGLGWVEIIRLPSPAGTRSRTREERRMLRESSYKRHLEGAKVRTFSIGSVGLMYTLYGSGVPLRKERLLELEQRLGQRVVYAEEAADGLLIITERPIKQAEEMSRLLSEELGKEVVIRPRGFERGLVVGLVSKRGRFLGIGVVKEIDYHKGIIRILTNVEGDVGAIQVGQLKLDDNCREIQKINGWPI